MSIDTFFHLFDENNNKEFTKDFFNIWANHLDANYVKEFDQKLNEHLKITPVTSNNQLSNLIKEYEAESLVLVLGAGTSIEYGLPSWETLLQKLLLSSFKKETASDEEKSMVLAKLFTKIFSPNPLIAARYLRNHFESTKEKPLSFEITVRKALYEHIKKDFKSELFNEIVKLCVAPGNSPNLNSIITYNYDDILETHLNDLRMDISYKTISTIGVKPKPGQLPIYHVHGYLPRKGKISDAPLVTLSEDAYHQQYGDIYSWNNMVQINKFRDNICLFIGLSLTDPNFRRLLDIANTQSGMNKPRHYAIRKRYDHQAISEKLARVLKIYPEILNDKVRANLELEETIKYLAQVIEKFETQDDLSFGINTLWVNEYTDIPKLLKAIRKKNPDAQI